MKEDISDQLFIKLVLNYSGRRRYGRRKRGFKFENMWVFEEGVEDVILNFWDNSGIFNGEI